MKKLAIYGAGGFGKETELLVKHINNQRIEWQFIGFFDDHTRTDLGGIQELNKYSDELFLVIAISNPQLRERISKNITNKRIKFANLVHPSVIMDSHNVQLGEGCIICANAVLTTDIKIGDHVIINLSCTIGHDAGIGDYCSVMPGAHISGNVKIGVKTLIGSGAVILQNLNVGKECIIGAGAVITKNVAEKMKVIGVPGREL